MKIKYLTFILCTFLFVSCENPLFRGMTGVFEASFETNGGTTVVSFEATTIEEPPTTTKTDCYFEGWYKQASFQDKISFPYTLTENTKFYAKWLQTYKVTFVTNGGSAIESYKTAKLDIAPSSTKENCILEGWYTTSDFSGEAITFPYDVTQEITLYAKWLITYNVNFETNGGSLISGYRTAKIDETPSTTRDGYSFCGWYSDSEFNNKIDFPYTLIGDTTLYAKWQQMFTVTFNTQGGTSVESLFTGYIESAPETSKTNKDFAGWYLDSECTETNKVVFPYLVTSNLTFYAKWIAQQVTITFYANGATSGAVPSTVSIDKRSDFLIPGNTGNLAKTGYAFTKWNTKADGTGTSYLAGATITGLDKNISLYAQWGKDYTTMILVNGGTFTMGNSADAWTTAHTVNLSDFYIGQYEITYELWSEVYAWASQNGYFLFAAKKGIGDTDSYTDYVPATCIYWYTACAWCNAYSEMKGLTPVYYTDSTYESIYKQTSANLVLYRKSDANGYQLPTEAQWEYAAGGGSGTRTKFSGTSSTTDLPYYAWYSSNSGSHTHTVGTKRANSLNIYDMTGNVNEWVFDSYTAYTDNEQTNPAIMNKSSSWGEQKISRGGSWKSGEINIYKRITLNNYSSTSTLYNGGYENVGFRVARNAY